MRVLIATDAWSPQINGVVRVLSQVARAAEPLGAAMAFLTSDGLWSVPLPTYPSIRLAVANPKTVDRLIASTRADVIHIATEGPVGYLARRYCLKNKRSFTTFFHTRFPDYVASRLPFPSGWVWAYLRQFHNQSEVTMASTSQLVSELAEAGFEKAALSTFGVDSALFHPSLRQDLDLLRPIFLYVGRLAVEKNIDAFLRLQLPGTKLVVGDGPMRSRLSRQFPDAVFLGSISDCELATIYASSDVFVFPSRTETFGLVLLEALASGLPVAAFPTVASRAVLADAPVSVMDEDLGIACSKSFGDFSRSMSSICCAKDLGKERAMFPRPFGLGSSCS
jgi:glycosyltransferase involved in cell wall biosynthesis